MNHHLQQECACRPRCRNNNSLASCLIAAARLHRHNLPFGHPSASISCGAVSKQGFSGGDRPGETLADVVRSLLRNVMTALSDTSSSSRNSSGRAGAGAASASAALPEDLRSASYAIAAANTALFLACALLPMLPSAAFLLNHRQPQIWQLFTSCFTHPSLESLMQCVFFTYIFGRVVERNHGSLATWAVYISCGAAAATLAWWLLPSRTALMSSAAPAAAWGLFLVGILLPRVAKKPLEVVCLLPFTFAATASRYSPLSGLMSYEGMNQGQLIHITGSSLVAVLAAVVLGLVEAWHEREERMRLEAKRMEAAAREDEALSRVINAATQAAAQIGRKLQ